MKVPACWPFGRAWDCYTGGPGFKSHNGWLLSGGKPNPKSICRTNCASLLRIVCFSGTLEPLKHLSWREWLDFCPGSAACVTYVHRSF